MITSEEMGGIGVMLALGYGTLLTWYRLRRRRRVIRAFYAMLSFPVVIGFLCDFPSGALYGAFISLPLGCLFGMLTRTITADGKSLDFRPADGGVPKACPKPALLAAEPIPFRKRRGRFLLGLLKWTGIVAALLVIGTLGSGLLGWFDLAKTWLAPFLTVGAICALIFRALYRRLRSRAEEEHGEQLVDRVTSGGAWGTFSEE